MHVLLIGAGKMAKEYAKVLKALNVDYSVIGRGIKSALDFETETGKRVITGGLEEGYNYLKIKPTHVIVASTLESLELNTIFLLERKNTKILIEKPGAINLSGLKKVNNLAKAYNSQIFIAYNRRFYASVIEAEKFINQDGGLKSFVFEFTEWSHIITRSSKTDFQLNNWLIGNSTHVMDLAFYFGGKPRAFSSFVSGELDWHKNGSIFVGAGITEKDLLFSYHANWEAPGSWKLELLSKRTRYIFRPLEKLKFQRLGSTEIEDVTINDELDFKYKPGIYRQVYAFLFEKLGFEKLLTIEKALEMIPIYSEIGGVTK